MFQARSDLYQSLLSIKGRCELAMLIWRFDQIRQRSLAEIKGDIEEILAAFLAIVPNNIWVIVALFQELDFLTGKKREIAQ
jgi:hypothetical protein